MKLRIYIFLLALSAILNNASAQTTVLTRQPYLQMASADAITIRWRTDLATLSRVRYGTTATLLVNFIDDSTLTTDHEVRLSSLTPNTTYYYSVGSDVDTLQGDSANYFVTSPVNGTNKKTRMWIFADSGVNTVDQNNVRDAFLNFNGADTVDRMIMIGDNAYTFASQTDYDDAVFVNHYENIFKHLPVWVAAGNHEMYTADATLQTGPYFDIFSLPKNAECGGLASGTEAFYSFDYGNIHFVCLETTTASFRALGGAMLTWLAADLAATTQKWVVVYMHHPPYTKGGHDSDLESDLVEVRQNILPILENYKVDVVFTGHNHQYERSYLLNGNYSNSGTLNSSMIVDSSSGAMPFPFIKKSSTNYKGTVYVQAGSAGVLEGPQPGWPHESVFLPMNTYLGSLILDVDADTLTVRYLDRDVLSPTVRDNFSIVKMCDIVAGINPVTGKCITAAPITLTAFPQGGIFSGNGITNNVFDPAIAGIGSHTINYLFTDSFGCTASATTVINVFGSVPQQPIVTNAPAYVCPPVQNIQLGIASVAGALSYTWSLGAGTTGVTFTSGVNDTSVTVNINPVAISNYTINIVAANVCGASVPQSIVMNRIIQIKLPVTGPAVACSAEIKLFSSIGVHALSTLTWTAPAGAMINGLPTPQTFTGITNVDVEFPAGFTNGKVCVTNHPSCLINTNIKCITVNNKPAIPGAITGANAVIAGTNGVAYSIPQVPEAIGYNWTMPANATIVSGQNTTNVAVDFSSSFAIGTISVTALSNCSQSRPQTIFVKSYSPFGNTLSKTSGSETTDDNSFLILPNPARDKLLLSFYLNYDETIEIIIYDLLGNKIAEQRIPAKQGPTQKEININSLSKGIYIARCIGSSMNKTKRFAKE